MSSIFKAIQQGDVELLKRALADGESTSQAETTWPLFEPLHAAVNAVVEGAPIALIHELIKANADVNGWCGQKSSTPLLMAVFRNLPDVVQALLNAGADPNVRDDEGDSPLRWCAQQRNLKIVKQLLLHGAQKTMNEYGGEMGLTALGHAVKNADIEMVKLLMSAGADPNALDEDGKKAAQRIPRGLDRKELDALQAALLTKPSLG